VTDALRYRTGQARQIDVGAGLGAIVFVEGELITDDQRFFQKWFDSRAREIRFFAQNGWKQVAAAVAEVRAELHDRRVFGIVDRDLGAAPSLDALGRPVSSDGVFRTARYTLENYLLEPEGWAKVLNTYSGRKGLPAGWDSTEAVQQRISEAVDACLAASAMNRTVRDEERRQPVDIKEFVHYAVAESECRDRLAKWRRPDVPPRPLVEAFEGHLASLKGASPEEKLALVSGKAALKQLAAGINQARGSKIHVDDWVSAYFREFSNPPADITRIVDAILSAP
jgi:hypothetical protein